MPKFTLIVYCTLIAMYNNSNYFVVYIISNSFHARQVENELHVRQHRARRLQSKQNITVTTKGLCLGVFWQGCQMCCFRRRWCPQCRRKPKQQGRSWHQNYQKTGSHHLRNQPRLLDRRHSLQTRMLQLLQQRCQLGLQLVLLWLCLLPQATALAHLQ